MAYLGHIRNDPKGLGSFLVITYELYLFTTKVGRTPLYLRERSQQKLMENFRIVGLQHLR